MQLGGISSEFHPLYALISPCAFRLSRVLAHETKDAPDPFRLGEQMWDIFEACAAVNIVVRNMNMLGAITNV
jgi:hypothetical protein